MKETDTTPKVSRTNLHLWLLTGRSGDFNSEVLNTGERPQGVGALPEGLLRARQVMRLDDTRTDFYVLGALASLYVDNALRNYLPAESSNVFIPGALSPPDTCLAGQRANGSPMVVSLQASGPRELARISGVPAGRQGFAQILLTTIARPGAVGTFRINLDNGTQPQLTQTRVSPDAAGTHQLIHSNETLAELGIHGRLRVPQCAVGDTFVLQISPEQYPYDLIAHDLLQDPQVTYFLSQEGLAGDAATATEPMRAVGIVASAIVMSAARKVNL